jgi:hypothetical protein
MGADPSDLVDPGTEDLLVGRRFQSKPPSGPTMYPSSEMFIE